MYTLTVDDRELVVTLMLGILRNLDPDGIHLGATLATTRMTLLSRCLDSREAYERKQQIKKVFHSFKLKDSVLII